LGGILERLDKGQAVRFADGEVEDQLRALPRRFRCVTRDGNADIQNIGGNVGHKGDMITQEANIRGVASGAAVGNGCREENVINPAISVFGAIIAVSAKRLAVGPRPVGLYL